jgi:hypothetical protein
LELIDAIKMVVNSMHVIEIDGIEMYVLILYPVNLLNHVLVQIDVETVMLGRSVTNAIKVVLESMVTVFLAQKNRY